MIYTPIFNDVDLDEALIIEKAQKAVALIERRLLKIEVDSETQMPYVVYEGDMFEVCKEKRGGEEFLALMYQGSTFH